MRKTWISIILLSFSMALGCYPLAGVEREMIVEGKGYYKSVNLNDKILSAVRQMVQTLKPEYRECDQLIKRYRTQDTSGYYINFEEDCKYTLGFVDITDLNRNPTTRLNKYFTEKVLTYSFLQDVFADHYVFIERIALPENFLIPRWVWNGSGSGNGGEDKQKNEAWELVYDSNRVGSFNLDTQTKNGDDSDKNKISNIRRRSGAPISRGYSGIRANLASMENSEKKKIKKKMDELIKALRTAGIHITKENLFRPDNMDGNDPMKVDPSDYKSQILAQFLGDKYDLDVVETGFLVDLGDAFELILRMIETRHGEVIAVGSVLIDKELVSDGLLYY